MEANTLFETGFSPGCPFFSFDFSSRSASTMRKREAGNPSRSASALASSVLLSICCVHKRRSLSAAASAPGRMDFLSPRNTIVEILGFTRFSLCFNKKRSLGYDRNDETGMPLPAFALCPPYRHFERSREILPARRLSCWMALLLDMIPRETLW